MTVITEELLEQFFYRGTFTRKEDKWKVVTEYGRVFDFDQEGFDLSQCLSPLAPGETEENREEMLYAACYFCQEVWGCIDVRQMSFIDRCRIAGYARGYGFTVDDNTAREFGISEAKAVFGEAAVVRNNWFPSGWRITVPEVGSVVIGLSGGDLNVKKIEGNLYEETLRFLAKRQGHAIVSGKTNFCMTVLIHGETLGINVIPEIPLGFIRWYLRGHLAWIPGIVLGFFISALFPKLSFWWLAVGGWALASVLMPFIMGDDRKRGEALINKFPQVGGRDAKLDQARERGMV
jgi:hypothetical protein